MPVSVVYEHLTVACAYRADFIIDRSLLLEIKGVDRLARIHHKQALTYLELLNLRHGLIMNFNCARLMDGLKSVVR